MVFRINSTLIENENVQIVENSSGDVAVISKTSGNIFTIDQGMSLSEVVGTDTDLSQFSGSLGTDGQVATSNGTGVEWRDASGGGGVDAETVKGIENTPRHVGPMVQGASGSHTTNGAGNMFWAEAGLSINSAVVDTDPSTVSTNVMTVVLAHYEGGVMNPTEVGRVDATVTGGTQRIDLSALPDIPSSGEYVLARVTSPNGEVMPARRMEPTEFGVSGYDQHTYDSIDFRHGTNITESGDWGSEEYYYYFFDISVGAPSVTVTSPWSTDVSEIYMRPRDPIEEFGDVDPRALWLDTSQ